MCKELLCTAVNIGEEKTVVSYSLDGVAAWRRGTVNIKRECGITSTLNVLGVRLFHIKEGVPQGYVFDYFDAVLVGEAEGG